MKSIGKNNLFLEIYGNSQKLITSLAVLLGKKSSVQMIGHPKILYLKKLANKITKDQFLRF